MQYKKGKAPFAIKDGKKTLIQVFKQEHGKTNTSFYVKALMKVGSNQMILVENLKMLGPGPSYGTILPKTHLLDLKTWPETVELHPDVFDDYVKKGIIAEDTDPSEIITESLAMDVNKDGVVDAKDVAEVANEAARIAAEDSITDNTESEKAGEDSTATDPAE